MRLVYLTFILSLLLVACSSPTPLLPTIVFPTQTESTPVVSLTGDWIGAVTKPDGSTASIMIHFDETESILNIEPLTKNWKLESSHTNQSLEFSVTGDTLDPFEEIKFVGTYSEENFSGDLTWDGQTSTVTFTPITSVDSSTLEKYEGIYKFESGRVLSIIVSPEYSSGGMYFFSQSLMMTDFESGALRSLYPLEEFTFAVGTLRVAGAPFVGQIQFITDDQRNAEGLVWWDSITDIIPSDTSGQYAERVSFIQEKITFTGVDGIKLSGLLSLPDSPAPHAAIMMLHGSEPGTKDNFGNKVMAHYMLSQGIAILNYDKRGVGESEGNYVEAASETNLQRHADDANAGVRYLLTRPEIDAKKIGLIGFSQAGWIIPNAVSQSQNISFFVILSGPVASTSHEDVFSNYADDGDSAKKYDDAEITQRLRDMNPGGIDPLPVIAELNEKGLWLWGSVDKSVPVTFGAENLQAIIDTGKDNFSYQIFQNGDHNLNESPNGLFAEIPYSPRVLFYSTLAQWLQENILADS